MDAIVPIARRFGAVVIEDACHALGVTYKGRKAGTMADMSVFSFHPVKPITTGEGGMVIIDNPTLAKALGSLATHGIEKDARCEEVGPWHYEMRRLSTNSRLSDLHAALGRTQLAKSDRFLQRRRALAKRYDELLAADPVFRPLTIPPGCESAYHLYPVLVRMDRLFCTKKELVEAFHQMNIGVQVHYIPVHRHPFYRNLGYTDEGLGRSVEFFEREISLPLFAKMSDRDQDDVITALSRITAIYGKPGQ
jgi:dTDP-4-amino-4,6-dideoxygalactose transaminase